MIWGLGSGGLGSLAPPLPHTAAAVEVLATHGVQPCTISQDLDKKTRGGMDLEILHSAVLTGKSRKGVVVGGGVERWIPYPVSPSAASGSELCLALTG